MHVQKLAQEVVVPQEHASHSNRQKCGIFAVYPQELWNTRSQKYLTQEAKKITPSLKKARARSCLSVGQCVIHFVTRTPRPALSGCYTSFSLIEQNHFTIQETYMVKFTRDPHAVNGGCAFSEWKIFINNNSNSVTSYLFLHLRPFSFKKKVVCIIVIFPSKQEKTDTLR